MTSVVLSPRVENPSSDTEAILNVGWWQIRPARTYEAGGQWVQDVWTPRTKFTGVAVTLVLDYLIDVPYELYMEIPNGRGGYKKTTEFRLVPATGPVNWEDCTLVDGPGANPVPTNVVNARLDALEAANPSGGATNLAGITDMSAFMRTVNDDTTALAARTTLQAAPLADPAFTGNPTAPTAAPGDNDTTIANTAFVTALVGGGTVTTNSPTFTGTTDLVNLDVSGTVVVPAASIAQAAIANLATDFAAKAPLASPTFTGTVVVPTAVGATSPVTKAQLDAIVTAGAVTAAVDGTDPDIVVLTF